MSNNITTTLPVPMNEKSSGEREQLAAETLDERLQRAREKRDRLVKERELQRIEDECALLERKTASDVGNDQDDGSSERNTHTSDASSASGRKRGASGSQYAYPTKRTLRPRDPEPYSGSSLRAHREFMRACENAFDLTPENFPNEKDKVMWAMQFLQGDPRDAWYTQWERMRPIFNPTWTEFCSFTKDQLADPINRGLEAATKHQRALQRPDQTVRAFATYLEILESDLPPYSEAHRVQHLYSKLRPEIQRAVTNFHVVPATREELVVLASTLERNLSRSSAPGAHHIRNKDRNGGKKKDNRDSFPHPLQNMRQDSGKNATRPRDEYPVIRCYYCNKLGHKKPDCPSLPEGKGKPRSLDPNRLPIRGPGKGLAS